MSAERKGRADGSSVNSAARIPESPVAGERAGGATSARSSAAASTDVRWYECRDCADYVYENLTAILHASSSVGIERGLTTNQMVNLYMEERHAEHA